ncbi:polysaccharide biosynthesis/export family protein [Sphingomonas sp.]|uniref:polysaccharide biosynthesis/export family protein n=1 Tax=Sphingomonas sp. TaxID=28214 RepID=UPI003B3A3218
MGVPVKGVLAAKQAAQVIAAVASLMLLAGCVGIRNKQIPVNPESFAAPDGAKEAATEPYRLVAQDRFSVTIYRVPDLSREYVVEPSGTVDFPLVGQVKVAGMTSAELAALLRDRYNRGPLRDPNVSVQIVQMTPQAVTVEGSVRTPGVLNVTGTSNLLQMIARAGGLDDLANAGRVVIFRQINGRRQAAAFDLRRVREGLMENPVVYPGDTLVVDGSELRRDMRDFLLAVPLLGLFRPF